MPPSARYLSYLLRLWVTTDAGQTLWRASLEAPAGGPRRGFASLPELFAFLSAQVSHDDPFAAGPTDEPPAIDHNSGGLA
ncbi:MAG: hypothetical protein ACUVX9_11525 [Anaerolineae bacterium]